MSLCRPGPVIDFLEQFVVLPNLHVVGLDFERLFVGLARFVELAFVLVGDRQVVERGGVGRVDLDGALPAVDRFAPEPALRDVDAEIDLGFRIAPRVAGVSPRGGDGQQRRSSVYEMDRAFMT